LDEGKHYCMAVRFSKVLGPLFRRAPRHRTREEEPRQARDDGVAATRAQSALLATVGHELRTPLSGILGLAGWLKDTSLDDHQRGYVEAIEGSAEALLIIINDILDLSRLDAEKLALRAAPFDLRDVVTAVARLLEPGARQKGLQISSRIAPEVPARLLGDAGRIRQVLTNLAANAVKFTDAGAVVLELQLLGAHHDGWSLRLSVADTGPGIPREDQAAVFEPFRQLDAQTNHRQGGLGLGLAICQSLVALLGGRIGLESEPGRGSTFWIELTLAEAPAVDPPRTAADTTALAPLDSPLRVLVAEDDPINRAVALEMIKRLGCEVDAVGDGPGAIAALENRTYDIVLMDVRLPGLDGPAVTAELRRRETGQGRHVPVIAITADGATGDAERCLEARMDDYIAKPLRPQALRQALVRWGQAGPDRRPHDPPSVPPTPRGDGPSLDRQFLAECCGSNPRLITDVLEAFLRSTPESLSAVAGAVALGAGPDLEHEAHRLMGACQTIGAAPMAAECATLLALARQGNLGSAPTALEALRNGWETVREEAGAYLETLRSG
jgi:CheY-like chemotaxis protein/nitrogen-specific signal transduction histidine kinase/HPt (histidine-containing phosphotransfer) domain-containing protein